MTMKKTISLLLCVLMISSFMFVASASDMPTVSLRLENEDVGPGEEISMTVIIENCPEIKSMALKPQYDKDNFELVSCEWTEEISDKAVISDYDSVKGNAAVAFLSPTDINGDVLVITLRAKEDSGFADYDISILSVIKNGDVTIETESIENEILVVCRHKIEEGSIGHDEEGHWRKCEFCYAKLDFEPHSKVNGVCTVCGEGDPRYAYGDADRDGSISSADARLILRKSVGLEEFDAEQMELSDVDFDTSISSADARLVLRRSVGLEPEFVRPE